MDNFLFDVVRLPKEKIERKSIDLKFEVSLQHAPLNSVILSPKFICTAVSNAF